MHNIENNGSYQMNIKNKGFSHYIIGEIYDK